MAFDRITSDMLAYVEDEVIGQYGTRGDSVFHGPIELSDTECRRVLHNMISTLEWFDFYRAQSA